MKIYLSLECCWWKNWGIFRRNYSDGKRSIWSCFVFKFWINFSPWYIHFLSILCVNVQTNASGICRRNFSHVFIGSKIQMELIERNIFSTWEYSFPQHTLCLFAQKYPKTTFEYESDYFKTFWDFSKNGFFSGKKGALPLKRGFSKFIDKIRNLWKITNFHR